MGSSLLLVCAIAVPALPKRTCRKPASELYFSHYHFSCSICNIMSCEIPSNYPTRQVLNPLADWGLPQASRLVQGRIRKNTLAFLIESTRPLTPGSTRLAYGLCVYDRKDAMATFTLSLW